mmetsp:Transcript_10952/g.14263  ORF Transcript_10952/g.14263 Transcript_10952/m.14263 type:complete len:169 (+) Transcript_10952:14-520(+)
MAALESESSTKFSSLLESVTIEEVETEGMSSLLESVHIAQPPPLPAQLSSAQFATKQDSFILNDVQTDIVVQAFSDRIFIIISQMNKVGNLLFATSEVGSLDAKHFDVRVLLGRRDDPLLMLYARQLIEQISSGSDLPLLLSISITEDGRGADFFQAIINSVLKLRCW